MRGRLGIEGNWWCGLKMGGQWQLRKPVCICQKKKKKNTMKAEGRLEVRYFYWLVVINTHLCQCRFLLRMRQHDLTTARIAETQPLLWWYSTESFAPWSYRCWHVRSPIILILWHMGLMEDTIKAILTTSWAIFVSSPTPKCAARSCKFLKWNRKSFCNLLNEKT